MIARLSKCVFWIPGKILDLYRKKSTKKKIFRDRKIFSKKSKKYFSRPKKIEKNLMKKSMKNENFKILIFSGEKQNFEIFIFH